jgi:hypothetical protein
VSTATLRRSRSACTVIAGLALLACSREPELDEVFPPPRRLGRAEAPERPPASRYDFVAGSEVEFRIGPRAERLRGRVSVVAGGLTVDTFDLALTRGHASMDLLTLELERDAPGNVQKATDPSAAVALAVQSGSLTERGLRWLELGDDAGNGALRSARPEDRYARFALTSIGALSAPNAFDAEHVRSDAPRVRRRVRLDASGELELHKVRFPYTARVDVIFEWSDATSATAENPSRIEIATHEAVSVDLDDHAIVPRRTSGEVDAEALAELRKGSRQPLWVTARWVAVPAAVAAGGP